MSPRPFVADSSPLLLPNSEAKNIWGAPDVNIGVSVFRNNVGSDQRVAKQELTVAGDAGRLVPSELLRRNLSFDHGASKEFSESNSRSFSTVSLSGNGNSSKKLNPLVSPFESQQQNYPFVTGQGWQYSTTHFNSYNAGNQQPTYSPSLSFNPPEQFRTENYGALTNSPNFSVSSSSRRVSSTPQYSNGTNGAESKSPEACADLRIVKEIQTSKLRVDESKLTSNYFDQLTHESIELCIHICPTMDERMRQEVAFRAVLDVARRAFPDANLHHFGSTALGFSLANADMDLSISLNDNYAKFTTAQLVEKLGVVMKNAGMRDVKMLTRARVPIVKIRDPITGIRCDIGFQSSLVMYNTRLLKSYSQIDPRFRELVFIVKYWSKQRNINEPYFGTLSSYCFVLMVIHFLQIRGVLPCLQKFAPDGTLESVTQAIPEVKVDDFNVYFYEDVARLVGEGHWTCTNTESVGELLVAFFKYYSAEFPYVHGVASVRTGSVLSKEDKGWTKDRQQEINRSGAVKDRYWLCVEDPFETTNNIGRPVDKETLFEVRGEFIRASKILCAGMSADENTLAKVCEKAPVIISKKGTGSGGGIGTNGMFMGGRKWM
ncbi:hypothetical protein BC830DRAFT_529272 [Chytriomyces sp. MP71]|nr:hypothetical protein BC830DRAFT_529272 [Chytriomyces sp. MP71]